MEKCANGRRSGGISRRELQGVSPFFRFDRYRNVLLNAAAKRNCAGWDGTSRAIDWPGYYAATQGHGAAEPAFRSQEQREEGDFPGRDSLFGGGRDGDREIRAGAAQVDRLINKATRTAAAVVGNGEYGSLETQTRR